MNYYFSNKRATRFLTFFTAAPAPGGALPKRNAALLSWDAEGAQSYVCPPASNGVSWTLSSSRAEPAHLTEIFGVGFQIR